MSYMEAAEKAKKRALALLDDKDGWKTLSASSELEIPVEINCGQENYHIEVKPSDINKGNMYRALQKVEATPQQVIDTSAVIPDTKRLEWDQDLREIVLIERLSENVQLYKAHTNSMAKGLISPREYVDVATWDNLDNGGILLTGCSVEYGPIQADQKYVRAFNHVWAFRVVPDEINRKELKFETLVEVDVRGWIPKKLIDAAVPSSMVASNEAWRKYLEKYKTGTP